MKQFKKECKHSKFEREAKWMYRGDEIKDGCWLCGGELTLSKKSPHTDTSRVDMEDNLRAELESNPKKLQEWLDWINAAEYYCKSCSEAKAQKRKEEWASGTAKYLTLDDMLDRHDQQMAEQIKEVEECGPDCVYYERLASWKREYNDDGTPKNDKSMRQMYEEKYGRVVEQADT